MNVMNNRILAVFGAMAIGLGVFGCESDNKPKMTSEALEARIQAAKGVSDPYQRDLALQNTAMDAARAQRVQVAQRAITDIADPRMCDETASRVARTFHQNGLYAQGLEIANMIADQQLKDQTLLFLAGTPSNQPSTGKDSNK
jgi:hypothetical protein